MLGSTMHPDGYHGVHARAGFFEGWYVKLVSANRTVRLAVIPGSTWEWTVRPIGTMRHSCRCLTG